MYGNVGRVVTRHASVLKDFPVGIPVVGGATGVDSGATVAASGATIAASGATVAASGVVVNNSEEDSSAKMAPVIDLRREKELRKNFNFNGKKVIAV